MIKISISTLNNKVGLNNKKVYIYNLLISDTQQITTEGVVHVDHWNKFILVRLEYIENDNPSNVLHRSASFCKLPITWNFNKLVDLEETDTVL